jgi:adenine-specific DNA-methyltransferase
MVAWAVTRADQSVLDPSCGDGVFLEVAAGRLRDLGASAGRVAASLQAVDLNPEAARITRERLVSELGLLHINVRAASFFSLPPPGQLFGSSEGVDVVMGNPPYIRYQDFAGGARSEALERAASGGVQLTRLASSWAHFVVHAVSFLRPGGRLALILPAELIHTGYAAPLREHLRRSFEEVHVVAFRQAVFPEVQAEVVLLLAAGKGRGAARLGLSEVENTLDLADLAAVLARAEVFAPGDEPEKWLPGYTAHSCAATLGHLQARGLLNPLEDIGKAGIGFVSGANNYFVLSAEEAERWRLPKGSLRPALIRARQIPGLQVTPGAIALMQSQNERCLLWLPREQLTRAEKAYVRHGEDLGYPGRYKCRVRSPWYRVPGVTTPEAFLTYMSDVVPRLCLNRARVVASNTLLTLRLQRIPPHLRQAFAVAFYNSATLLFCEQVGRSYGGGVLKLEPREADRILVPSADLVARHRRPLEKLKAQVDGALRNARGGRLEEAVAAVDAILFASESFERRDLASARAFLQERRQARARPGTDMQIAPSSSRRGS